MISTRALVILALSLGAALLAGLGMGVSAGLNVAGQMGDSWALIIGLTSGLGSALVAGPATASTLHSLITHDRVHHDETAAQKVEGSDNNQLRP